MFLKQHWENCWVRNDWWEKFIAKEFNRSQDFKVQELKKPVDHKH